MNSIKKKQPIDLKSFLVLSVTPLAAIILVPYYSIAYGFSSFDWICFTFFMISTGLSITAGYHRLWSHRSYQAKLILKIFFMLFGTAALQNSILKWSSDHRRHHRFVDDKEKDPYAVTRGFFYSHFAWMLRSSPKKILEDNVKDLRKEKPTNFMIIL